VSVAPVLAESAAREISGADKSTAAHAVAAATTRELFDIETSF
jgi:hypothetical protein